YAVFIDDGVRERGGDARPRRDDADQVQRIAGRQADDLAALRLTARGAQGIDRVGARELLAHEAADEAAAPQLTAHLKPPVDAHEIAPRRRLRLAPEQIAEHDAVSLDVLARERFVARLVGQAPLRAVLGQRRRCGVRALQRPAPG